MGEGGREGDIQPDEDQSPLSALPSVSRPSAEGLPATDPFTHSRAHTQPTVLCPGDTRSEDLGSSRSSLRCGSESSWGEDWKSPLGHSKGSDSSLTEEINAGFPLTFD